MPEIAHKGYRPTIWEELAGAPHPSLSFQSSFWHSVAPAGPAAQRLAGEARTEIAVVGGGFLGLSAALHLAEAGRTVTLLEADEAGFGASGRNTGFVVPNLLTSVDLDDVRGEFGAEKADLLLRMLGESGELVFDLIRRHGIDCWAKQTGWMQPIHSPVKRDWLEERVRRWQDLGRPVKLLSREEAVAETGSEAYHGAFLDPTGGHLNPLAFVRGLAAAAVKAGVTLFIDSRAKEIGRHGAEWRLKTDHGTLVADKVLLATNGTGGGLAPRAEGTQFPITLFQVATQQLDPDLRKSVLPNDRCSADTRKELIAYRWTDDNRIVTGGLLGNPLGSTDRGRSYHLRRLEALLPQLPELRADFAWQGRIAVARNYMPRLMRLGDGAFSAIACNGRGIAMTTALGRKLALWLDGGSNEDLPLPVTDPDPVLFPKLAPLAFSLWLPFSRRQDARDLRSS
ncbi:NAD(P)/FAD-dependent oxidoreductase [Nisaea sp.]|uniref:NAD(P)/FAD-dependent oxidoreductase n=1 Tax=Nisaea sp. TaxID=2024842 RepID=UPI003B5263A0